MSREAGLDPIVELAASSAAWLDAHVDALGQRICTQHGVEHLGKTAYRIHLGLLLWRERGEPLDEVVRTARHLASTCHKYPHPDARAFLFFERWPDPWNCSNHLIDSGAICDALGRLLIEAPDELPATERHWFLGVLAGAAAHRIVLVEPGRSVRDHLGSLPAGPWWPPLDRLLDGIEHAVPDQLGPTPPS